MSCGGQNRLLYSNFLLTIGLIPSFYVINNSKVNILYVKFVYISDYIPRIHFLNMTMEMKDLHLLLSRFLLHSLILKCLENPLRIAQWMPVASWLWEVTLFPVSWYRISGCLGGQSLSWSNWCMMSSLKAASYHVIDLHGCSSLNRTAKCFQVWI